MNKKFQLIYGILEQTYPNATITLKYNNDFQLLVAVILSAQCTDERVNKVTPALFKRFPHAEDFASADIEDIKKLIYSTGFYNSKAKNIKNAALSVVNNFNGNIPDNMSDLLTLAGVARKTANVILCKLFSKPSGVVVDTHVIRLSGRLGLVPKKLQITKNAGEIEKRLMKILKKTQWCRLPDLFIFHGRRTCTAFKPKCVDCPIEQYCPSSRKDVKA